MELIVVMSNLIKMFMISIFTYFLYNKITNCRKNDIFNIVIIMMISINISLMYVIFTHYLNPLITVFILFFLYVFIMDIIIMKYKINYIAFLISAIISYIIYFVSILISGILLLMVMPNFNNFKKPISILLIPIISIILLILIFNIKRFKNGVGFIKNYKENRKVIIFTMIFTGIILVFFGLFQKNNSNRLIMYLIIGTIFSTIGLTVWLKSQITKTYKSKMRDRTIEMQKAEIDENARIIEELKAENIKLASAVHKYNKKFSALEFAMQNALETGVNTEFANELSVILEETKDASKNFAKEVEIKRNKLPLTNNVGIDNMLKYMQEEARKKDINFDFKLNTSINPLLENAISKDKFETLIGDHLKDAIIAVNASSNSYKSILVTLGIIDGVYELSIYDTGIEFEIETLLKLGQEQVTTHKDEGGSGIGFMTTFETLKECKASLIIEEYNPETTNYTKAVIIRFDGKNQYKIYSYRTEKIKEQKHKCRIIIEKLK